MSDDQINIAIAEILGLKYEDREDGRIVVGGYPSPVIYKLSDSPSLKQERIDNYWSSIIPRYTHNLDACHEMEKSLSAEPNEDPEIAWFTEQEEYVMQLEILTKSDLGLFPEVHASAGIRAEAFLRVKRFEVALNGKS